jgi:hypothetical protein
MYQIDIYIKMWSTKNTELIIKHLCYLSKVFMQQITQLYKI